MSSDFFNSLVTKQLQRTKILVNGIVQGVGFRPFVYNLAKQHHLTGFVANTSQGVTIEIEGNSDNLKAFVLSLKAEPPPLSIITEFFSESISPLLDKEFLIHASDGQAKVATLISPDVAVCHDCLKELFDPADRRYRYPFINCTNCGPRYTIIENIPYDRPFTSMRHFAMCPDCQAEYDDPGDRRFHAQPNACAECGPHVSLYDSQKQAIATDDPIIKTAELIKAGQIIAIKGLGGFHLVVDATNGKAVNRLRRRKNREEKPLAIMIKDIEEAKDVCVISPAEENALTTFQCPIVLLIKKGNHGLAESVAPGNDRFGVMLPYTPLHHLLMHCDFSRKSGRKALVMTSANYSEEPICIDNNEAFERMKEIADYFLIHDRDIYLRSDDSVVIHLAGRMRQMRRSRGFVPRPIFVESKGSAVLAVGGELKNTVCLLKDNQAFLSQHIGDLENLEAYNFFKMTIEHLERIFEIQPQLIVHDLHPQYLSTQWAKDQHSVPILGVQHHHAHLAACMAENKISGPVIGLIMDGTGYGTDNTIWGGEVLIGNYGGFTRYAHFQPMPLPGGDAAIKAPWRTAVSYLHEAFEGKLPDLPFLKKHDVAPVLEMISKRVNSPLASSCGRLFDAVAAMSGGKQVIRYEAQAAIELMQEANDTDINPFDFEIVDRSNHKEMLIVPIIHSVVDAVLGGDSLSIISSRFHRTLIELFTQTAVLAKQDTGIKDVVLSGGVFQNQLLFEGLIPALEKEGLTVYTHKNVPTNDGGLALGQAMIGRESLVSGNIDPVK